MNDRTRLLLPDKSHTTTSWFRSVVNAVVPSGDSTGPRSGTSPVPPSDWRIEAVATFQITSRESFPAVITD